MDGFRIGLIIIAVVTLLLSRCFADNFEEDGKLQVPRLSKDIVVEDFLNSYNYYPKYDKPSKNIQHATLAYVTPWNSRGYEVSKIYSEKFSLISPVWLQLKPATFVVEGLHDIDEKWMESVRKLNDKVKFVPRIIFDQWSGNDFRDMLDEGKKENKCLGAIIKLCKKYNFDGITVEVWSQHSGTSQNLLVDFVNALGMALHKREKLLILPIPPSIYEGGMQGRFNKEFFDLLQENVDYFSLMTYDYSHKVGPNSPINWVRECVQLLVPDRQDKDELALYRSKLLVGFNFYGLQYNSKGRGHVLGRDVVRHLKENPASIFEWHEEWAEHSYKFQDSKGQLNMVFYPSQLSVARRVELVEELGTGVSIWEIGQGLDSFYNLL